MLLVWLFFCSILGVESYRYLHILPSELFQFRLRKVFAGKDDVLIQNLDTKEKIVMQAGEPLSLAAYKTGTRLSYQCKQGTCGSCEALLDGKVVRTCITNIPSKKSITLAKAKRGN